MTQLKIKVTKEILEKSKYCGSGNGMVSTNCAIAKALATIFPDCQVAGPYVAVHISTYKSVHIPLPFEAEEFINLFDQTLPFDRPSLPELEFTIDIPDAVIEQINIEEIRPLLINHPTLELVEC